MTAWDPSLSVTIDGIAVTDLVDYSMSFYRGSNGPYAMPQAGTGSLTLIYTSTPRLLGKINSKIVVTLADDGGGSPQAIWTGWVSDMSVQYQAYGAAGHITEVSYSMVGPLALFIGQTYVLDATTTKTTAAAISTVLGYAMTTSWNETQPDLTWSNVTSTLTWANWDSTYSTYVITNVSGTGPNVTLTAGTRDVAGDLEDLFNGSHSIVTETGAGYLYWYVNTANPTPVALSPSAILTDVQASISKSDMRNQVTASTYNGTTTYYTDTRSVKNYGPLAGSVQTLLANTSDALTAATYMAKGLSPATVGITGFSVDCLNPAMTAAERAAVIDGLNGSAYTLSGLDAVYGEMTVIVWAQSWQIDRNQFRISFTVGPRSQFSASPAWDQITNSYTWTSYGVANPTQKWSDL